MVTWFVIALRKTTFWVWITISRSCSNLTNYCFYLPFGGFHQFYLTCSEFGSIQPDDRVLDLCCGNGELTAKLADLPSLTDVMGIDIDDADLKKAALYLKNLPVVFVKADVSRLPLYSGIFTKCFISMGLHHLNAESRWRTLQEINRVLTPDGMLFIIDYNLPRSCIPRFVALTLVKTDRSPEAYEMVTNDSLITETGDAGFTLVRKREIGGGMIQLLELKKNT